MMSMRLRAPNRHGVRRLPLRFAGWIVPLLLAIVITACATIGHEFPVERVSDIQLQRTTQAEIRSIFGEPWRVGIEDGQPTWTYAKYRYKLFGQPSTQDLVVRFDERGTVVSYTFNTTEHDEQGVVN